MNPTLPFGRAATDHTRRGRSSVPAMKLIFIDEVEQPQKAPGFFGIGALIVTSTFYRGLKEDINAAFKKAGWDQDEEFKGRYLFSSSKGDTDVGVDARIELVRTIVTGTTAAKNARAMFCLAFNYEGRNEANYLALARQALRKCPKPANKKGDKNLAAVFYDRTDIAGAKAIGKVAEEAATERKVTLVETPTALTSSNDTPGLVVADILAYLKSWDVISPNPDETEQAAVFERAVDQLHADKLKTIRAILQRMKRVTGVGP
jgi:hypothetical protein